MTIFFSEDRQQIKHELSRKLNSLHEMYNDIDNNVKLINTILLTQNHTNIQMIELLDDAGEFRNVYKKLLNK